MANHSIYTGPVVRIYNLFPFSNLMNANGGRPIPEVFRSEHDGARYCAWEFEKSTIITLKYYNHPKKKGLQAIVSGHGDEKEINKLKRMILDEAADKQKWERMNGVSYND